MSKGSTLRKTAATFALTVSVLAPAGMVVSRAAPAYAHDTVSAGGDEPAVGILLPAVQKVREAARR